MRKLPESIRKTDNRDRSLINGCNPAPMVHWHFLSPLYPDGASQKLEAKPEPVSPPEPDRIGGEARPQGPLRTEDVTETARYFLKRRIVSRDAVAGSLSGWDRDSVEAVMSELARLSQDHRTLVPDPGQQARTESWERQKQMRQYPVIALLLIAVLTAYGLDHGIYMGSTSYTVEGVIHKNCQYLFVTGISETRALGGVGDLDPALRGMRNPEDQDDLYCHLFRD